MGVIFHKEEEEKVVEVQGSLARKIHLLIVWIAGNFTALLASPDSDFARCSYLVIFRFLLLIPFFRITSLNGLLTPVWAALALVGLLWGVWARWTMGSVWRGIPEVRSDHKLITSGYEKLIPFYSD